MKSYTVLFSVNIFVFISIPLCGIMNNESTNTNQVNPNQRTLNQSFFLNQKSILDNQYDLMFSEENNISNTQFGSSVATVDVNGDDFTDLIISEPGGISVRSVGDINPPSGTT